MIGEGSVASLLARLDALEVRVRAAVAHRRAADPAPDDPFRGLYVSDEQVDRLLEEPGGQPADIPIGEDGSETTDVDGAQLRLRRLVDAFELGRLDLDLLIVALAPDLDARFERLYGYLHDDVTRRRASVGLALELCGRAAWDIRARCRLEAGSPLVDGGLVVVEDSDRPLLTRALRVPDRVSAHLLGNDNPDASVLTLLAPVPPHIDGATDLAAAIGRGLQLAYLRERPGRSGRACAASAFAEASAATLVLDLERAAAREDPRRAVDAVLREARLRCAGLVAGPVEALVERSPEALRVLARAPWPVLLHGQRAWDPGWSERVPLVVDVPATASHDHAQVWESELEGAVEPGLDARAATAAFRLDAGQVIRAAIAARLNAGYHGRLVGAEDVRIGALAQNAAGLERLARRVPPAFAWDDLVLPPQIVAQLCRIGSRVRHRERVLGTWALRGRTSITALFAGPSGTGKTMACEVLARDLGVDLYVVDLATVVDKYIGETEKNLDRIFVEAERVNAVIVFDEADALFGKRSEVHDAHDRYANIEIAYLLQRMETFDGIAVMTTNLRANIDDAFTRRLDAIVNFPMPDGEARGELWDRCLGPLVPRDADLDIGFCARAFELSGGDIRNITLAAAYMAAEEGRAVCMGDLMRATGQEYRKLGRLCLEAEFGPHLQTATS